MSDYELKRINALTEASAIGDDDVFALDSVNGTKKVKWSTIDGKVGDKVDGMLATATVPNAEQLIAHTGITDTEPYFSRPSASIGDREFDELVGGTLGWNQQYNVNYDSTTKGVTIHIEDGNVNITGTSNSSGNGPLFSWLNFTFPAGHVVVILKDFDLPTGDYIFDQYSGYGAGVDIIGKPYTIKQDQPYVIPQIKIANANVTYNITGHLSVIDLTVMFGSTIADYIYSLEQATAGAGVAWVRRYLTEEYYAYCAPTLKHVTGVSAHVMRDANDNVIGNYPLDSTWVGMGIPKLDSENKLYFDGDRYASDGTVTVKYAIRAYESGDTSDGSTMITDGTNTVYKLTTSTTDSATPYTSPQIVDKDGTEEYVTTGLVPVGHETLYPIDIRGTIETISETPTEDGTYTLKCTVAGGVPTMEWVSE